MSAATSLVPDPAFADRVETLLEADHRALRARTDRLFAGLLTLQWLACIFAALLLAPTAWQAAARDLSVHAWVALLVAALLAAPPIALALTRPGRPSTGHVIAIGQMLASAFFIHLSGGRIEAHFHVFCLLALLAYYRDVRILFTATLVIAAHNFLLGALSPASVYGIPEADLWRPVEHLAWVLFEVGVLVVAIRQQRVDMREVAEQRVRLEDSRSTIEAEMLERTRHLRESEARFRTLSTSSPIGIFETDGHGRAVYTNRRWQEIFGMTLEDSLGDGWATAIHEEEREAIVDGWHAATSRARPFDRVFRVRLADGDERWVHSCAASIVDETGAVTGFVGTVEDVTRQKRDEEELVRAREDALSAARLKSEFLANMSHEIRTPLNGVIGMTDLALETELTAEQREYLETARTSADFLLAVIEDILDFSKIEAGKLELDPTETDLRETLGATLKTLALRAEKKGLELVSHVRPGVPESVLVDAGRLRQVLLNLVGNALKFTAEGEVVVRVDAASPAGEDAVVLHFCVADTGIGIPADKQAAIFESFTQADMSTTRRFGGTGLGLAICARLVGLMGGRIWVESEPGRGSQFHFTVRAGAVAPAAGRPADAAVRAPLAELGGRRALVVDDNATNRQVLVEMLSHWRMEVTAAEDGPSALARMGAARAAGTPFELVLLDGRMPLLDGFDVARRIRDSPELAPATLMMLTSGGQAGDAARCRELGIGGYLVKPVSRDDLAQAIQAALPASGGRRPGAPPPEPAGNDRVVAGTAGPRAGLRILVAEDNAVNQLVAVRLLAKLGHQAAVADNGLLALQLLEREAFDLVIMDVQMPVMGGLEATAELRAREGAGARRTPILGLTAHAMKGDLERCIEAGMDDVVTKPVKLAELVAAIDRLAGAAPAVLDRPAADDAAALAVFDRGQAEENACGDAGLLAEIARIFQDEGERQAAEARQGLAAADAAAVERAAHRLRGSLSTLGACRAAALAGRVEDLAEAGDLAAAHEAFAALERALAEVRPALDGLAGEPEQRRAA